MDQHVRLDGPMCTTGTLLTGMYINTACSQCVASEWTPQERGERQNKGRAESECKENKPGSKVQLKAVKLQLSRAGDVVSAKNNKNKTLPQLHPQHVTSLLITS